MRTVVKNLKKYNWTYSNKQITITDKTTEQSVVLDKVGFMSLARFILRSLDSMRIDKVREVKLHFSSAKKKYKDFKENQKNKNKKTLEKKPKKEM